MHSDANSEKRTITKGYRNLLLATGGLTTLLIIMGGVVCTTESGAGCPDWPACYGRLVPPMVVESIIEYTHRVVAALTTPFIIASAVIGWRKYRSVRWVRGPLLAAVLLTFAVIVFGALAVLRGLPPWAAALDLGSALLVLASVVTAATAAVVRFANPALKDKLAFHTPHAKLALWTAASVYIVLVSGVLTAEPGSVERCFGWPILFGSSLPVDTYDWLQMVRRVFAFAAGVILVIFLIKTWRRHQESKWMRRMAVWTAELFLLEVATLVLLPVLGFPVFLLVFYSVAAAVSWAGLVALVVLTGMDSPNAGQDISG